MIVGAIITAIFGSTDLEEWALPSSKPTSDFLSINNENYEYSINNDF